MQADEWFLYEQVSDIFIAFVTGTPFPDDVQWRAVPGF